MQRLLGCGGALLQLDNINIEGCTSLGWIQITVFHCPRAGYQLARRAQEFTELSVTQLIYIQFRLASRADTQQIARRETTSRHRVQDPLFNLCLLPGLSTFDGIDEIEWSETELVQTEFLELDHVSNGGVQPFNHAEHSCGIAEQFASPGI